ncbi:hypothetical protein [Sporocytophaga myxococcoides]|nr:hypothetical protein [Sporocytophaga myxococcoides]
MTKLFLRNLQVDKFTVICGLKPLDFNQTEYLEEHICLSDGSTFSLV